MKTDLKSNANLGAVIEYGGCISTPTTGDQHAEMDAYGKANGMTVTYSEWHPNPEYRIFKTGSLLSRNDKYPSGLVIVDEKGVPHLWHRMNQSA